MRTLASSLLLSTVAATFAAPAFAGEVAPSTTNAFATMDNTGDGSKIEAETSIMPFIDEPEDAPDVTMMRTNILGQYVTPEGFGGYAGVDIMHAFAEGLDDDYTELGNLQLGGLYQRSLAPNLDLGLRVGLVLPTATDDGLEGALHILGTGVARPSDLPTALADSTWLRLGASPTFRQGIVFARADVGLDIPLDHADDMDVDPFAHVNLGIGAGKNGFVGTAELQTAIDLGGREDGDDDGRFIHTAAVSARYQGKVVAPFLAVSSPLDDGVRGEIFTVTAGIAAPL